MVADSIQVLRILRIRGVRVKVENGQLIAGPAAVMTDELRQLIRHNRDLLIAQLESQQKAIA